jgi:hypothetical protein
MSDQQTVTLRIFSDVSKVLIEVDVPSEAAELMNRGEDVVIRSDWPRREITGEEAVERWRTHLDELQRRQA